MVYVYRSHHHLYPVTEKRNLLGYISLREVKSIAQKEWKKVLVKQIMVPRSKFCTVSPDATALQALNLIQQGDSPTLLVVAGDRLVGILAAQDLFKLIALKVELEEETCR